MRAAAAKPDCPQVLIMPNLRNNCATTPWRSSASWWRGQPRYNTWRKRTHRAQPQYPQAGFELLTKLAELERVVFLAQYDRDTQGGNPRTG